MKEIKAVMIIGNGFDLSLKVNSAYKNFLTDLIENDSILREYYENEQLGVTNHSLAKDKSIWPYIILLNNNGKDLKWVDVELEIYNFIKRGKSTKYNIDKFIKYSIEIINELNVYKW